MEFGGEFEAVKPDRTDIVLASGSPRRLALLRSIGWYPIVAVPAVDETRRAGESPVAYVARVAARKGAAVLERCSRRAVVLAADTAIDLDGEVLGKPADRDDACAMLTALAGREHVVHTGVAVTAVVDGAVVGEWPAVTISTRVTFAALSSAEIQRYLDRGESWDKAGSYAIQGAGAALVERIVGSPSNVVGLPLREADVLLRTALNLASTAGGQRPAVDRASSDKGNLSQTD